uniref:Lipase n=1 Tax=Strigamia maritima TaxID=126957 RepID=T1IRA1_STRMM
MKSQLLLLIFLAPSLNSEKCQTSQTIDDLQKILQVETILKEENILSIEEIENDYRASVKTFFPAIDPEAFMNVTEIIKYHGYPVEEHIVETSDGYVLKIQRIPHGKNGLKMGPGKPVLLQHGLLASSVVWVTNTPDKNLAYLLADAGYDVWLGNIRGTVCGYNNTNFSPNDKRFWQFSFDEMAKYDVPSVIQTVLKVTKYKQIYYVGHSMGTTMLFALLSSQPEYNNIIKAGFTLAPVTLTHNIRGALRVLSHFLTEVEWIYKFLQNGKFYLPPIIADFLARTLCDSPLRVICENTMFLLSGFDYAQTNATRLPVHVYHTPDATSLQTMTHYAQLITASHFQYYDYGTTENWHHYNQSTPPIYNLSKITTPISIFWANNDYLADPTDVTQLVSQLKNVSLVYEVPFSKFNHLDFMWAIDVKPLLYNKLLDALQKQWTE